MAIYEQSRYVKTAPYVTSDGVACLEVRSREKFNADPNNNQVYEVTEYDTLDGIAYTFYGNEQLGWLILDANKLMSELDIKMGVILNIPDYVESNLKNVDEGDDNELYY